MSPENIRDEINRGGRLVIHMYCVSILILTFKRSAPLRLVRAGHSPAAAGWPYLLLTLVCGWWGFPWGPIYTIECLYRNLCGGLDVTDDVLRQLLPAATTVRPGAVPPAPAAAPARGIEWKTAGLLATGLCLIVSLGFSLFCYQRQQDLAVVLVSGLAEPYSVTLNGQTYTLKPYGAEVVALAEGDFVLADAPGGKVVGGEQKFTLAAPLFDHLRAEYLGVINPDRAAVLLHSEVPYYNDNTTPPADETPVFSFLVNQPAHFMPKPDFVLVEADRRISMSSGTPRLVKTRLSHLGDTTLGSVMNTLVEKSGYPAAREHLMTVARRRTDEALLIAAAQTLKPEDLRPFFQLHLADRPVLVEWHRYYQGRMEALQPDHDLLAEYRGYAQAEPGDGALLYLLGRQLPDPAEQTRMFQAALAATPPCAYAHAALGFDALSEGLFAEAAAHYETSRQAGVISAALTHYRQQAFLALGRTAEILPELAAARKKDPFDLRLADEEIRTTYAATRDLAAARRLKDAYLAAYKAAHASAKDLAEADDYLQAGIAYATGDLPDYARLVARFPVPFYQFRAALTNGRLADAAKTAETTDAEAKLLLYLLAQRSGDTAAAEQHFQAAHQAMKKDDQPARQVAAQLDAGPPDARAVCTLHMNIESKRILLTALGVRYPADRAAYFGLARKLNYNLDFPHHFLRSFLSP